MVKPRLSALEALSSTPSEVDEANIAESLVPGVTALRPVLRALEGMLGDGPYALGQRITAADCLLYPPLADLMAGEIPEGVVVGGYIRVAAWVEFFRTTRVAQATRAGTLEAGDRP